jgi:diacylglycerol kinase family enzyme
MPDGPAPQVLGTTIPVIANAAAGGGHSRESLDALREAFRKNGIDAEILADGGLAQNVRRALRQSPPVVVAAGGDGTVSAVAHELRGSATPLAIVPYGTFNHFAKDLGIPHDPAAAARAIVDGRVISVDMGEVNGRTFVNNASLGLYPSMVRKRDKLFRRLRHGKRMAMLWAMLTAVRRSPLLTLRIEMDGAERSLRSPFVFVGNNAYAMEGFDIGRRERIDCGRLCIYTTQRGTFAGLACLALRALAGRLSQDADFSVAEARRLRVETPHRRLVVATDGELDIMDTPLDFRILPGALQVVVPRKTPE